MSCFVDTMRPITPAETEAWQFYLEQPRHLWKALRASFRRVYSGDPPDDAMILFVSATACCDPELLSRLEAALQGLGGSGHVEVDRRVTRGCHSPSRIALDRRDRKITEMPFFPQKPNLDPAVLASLKRLGATNVRVHLARTASEPESLLALPSFDGRSTIHLTRQEAALWLEWMRLIDAAWIKIIFITALLAGIVALAIAIFAPGPL